MLLVTFLAFYPTLKADFVHWDDEGHLLENVVIRSLDAEHIREIFSQSVQNVYIPLTTLSFALEYHFFGYNPFVYHLTNLLLHLLIVLLIYGSARLLGLGLLAAFCAGTLFGIHPMHVESVAWITERKDVLYAFFYMLAIFSYLLFMRKNEQAFRSNAKLSVGYLVFVFLFGALSMLAKPMALSLPLILLWIDWYKDRKIDIKVLLEKLPLGIMIGAVTWITYSQHVRVPGDETGSAGLIWIWTFIFYLKQFFIPLFNVPIYRLSYPISIVEPEYLFSLIAFLLIGFSVFRLRKYRLYIFALGYFLFSIFFLLRFDAAKDTNVVADRFMYLPSLGFCLLFGFLMEVFLKKAAIAQQRFRLFVVGFLIVSVFTFLGVRTYKQCQIWDNTIALWKHELKYFPKEHIALNNLGVELQGQESFKEAVDQYSHVLRVKAEGFEVKVNENILQDMNQINEVIGLYERAVRSKPDYVRAFYNLGNLYKEIGLYAEAVRLFNQAIATDPYYKDSFMNLGNLYRDVGEAQKAIESYTKYVQGLPDDEDVRVYVVLAYNKALEMTPKIEKAYILYKQAREEALNEFTRLINTKPARATSFFNLGFLYSEIGDLERAISAYRTVLDINPHHGHALYSLGNIFQFQGQYSQAMQMYQKSLKVLSRHVDTYTDMGTILEKQGKGKEARNRYEQALDVDVDNHKALYRLAYLDAQQGLTHKALEAYLHLIELNYRNANAYNDLGVIYVKLEDSTNAQKAFERAVELDQNNVDAWINLSNLSFIQKDYQKAIEYLDEAVFIGYEAPVAYLKALEAYRN